MNVLVLIKLGSVHVRVSNLSALPLKSWGKSLSGRSRGLALPSTGSVLAPATRL